MAPAPETAEPLELQAAMSVTAATAASAAVVVAREGPVREGHARASAESHGNLLVALSGSAARAGAGRGEGHPEYRVPGK